VDADEWDKAIEVFVFEAFHFGGFHFNAFESPFGGVEPRDGLGAVVEFEFGTDVFVGSEHGPDVVGDDGVGVDGFGVVVEEAVNVDECLGGYLGHDFYVR